MELKQMWQKFEQAEKLNYKVIEPYLSKKGLTRRYSPGDQIISRGEFPQYIYFIIDGTAVGQRLYENGNEYHYFQVDYRNGNLGLLEILSKKENYVATVTCLTEAEVIQVRSTEVYEIIMSHLELLQKCTFLLADDLYQSSEKEGQQYYSGIDRLRLFLLDYFVKNEKDRKVLVEMSYEEISSRIGVSARTVGRSIKKMKELDEVCVYGKKVMINERQSRKMKEALICD